MQKIPSVRTEIDRKQVDALLSQEQFWGPCSVRWHREDLRPIRSVVVVDDVFSIRAPDRATIVASGKGEALQKSPLEVVQPNVVVRRIDLKSDPSAVWR